VEERRTARAGASDGEAERENVYVERMVRARDVLRDIKREEERKREKWRGRKLNNQTFPQGSRGLLWQPTPSNGGEVTGKNQKNKR